MLEALAKPVVFTIAAVVVAMVLRLGIHAQPNARGWRQIKPGAMYWTGVILSAAAFFLMAYVWLFVGSKRADAETQMRILFWLALAFGLGSIVCAASIHSIMQAAVRWRGGTIAYRGKGVDVRLEMGDARALRPGLSGIFVEFEGGERLCISPYAAGAQELLDAIADKLASRQSSERR